MNSSSQAILPSSAASPCAPDLSPLDLCEARQARDGLATLLRAERTAAAGFLLALSDFDRRRGWEPLGHSSLFAFLVAELRLSKGAAYVRSSASRLLQAFPAAMEPLQDGRLCLSSVGELARVASPENFSAVLPRFFGCSSREAREVAAAIMPREVPPVRDQVTRLASTGARSAPVEPPATALRLAPGSTGETWLNFASPADSGSVRAHEPPSTQSARAAAPGDDVEPLTAELRRLHVTVDRQFLKMLDAARDGLSHSIPGASTEQVLKAALELLLEKQARTRGQVKRPRKVAPSAASTASPTSPAPEPLHRRSGPRETIPADVRRAVWARDGGRCTWPLDGGGCCGSTHRLELDHVIPWARGSVPTVDGLRILCRPHNLLAARLAFGSRWMGRYAGAGSPPLRR
jgi:hypothetical protein